ncbi:DUF7523 family protein [Halorhabdus amylolytica]|uniref:DUF7523 family protein n=1 Tax=Halorhabdus amylolytica TaxID=2559573 RepID=UPI0010AADC44|nr:hypothetical protein [Halorhabdus amylolytica]
MTLAEQAREAVRARPFVHEALRAGVINYSAAARMLDVGEEEPVAAALRRYAAELSERDMPARSARVTIQSGVGRTDDPEERLLAVGDAAFASGDGPLTAVLVNGDVDAWLLTHALARLDAEDITVEAAGVADGSLLVVVERRDGPRTVQFLEELV